MTVRSLAAFYRGLRVANQGRRCVVSGCEKLRHENTHSPYCNAHKLRNERHGAPNGAAVPRWRLRPFEQRADAFMRANLDHPVIKKASDELQQHMDDADRHMQSLGSNPYVRPNDHQTKLQRELQRLKAGGASGADLFEAMLSLHLYARSGGFELATPAYEFALCRSVLSVVPRAYVESVNFDTRTKRKDARRYSTVMLRTFGRELSSRFGVVLHLAALAIEKEAARPPLTRAQAIAAAVAREPFTT